MYPHGAINRRALCPAADRLINETRRNRGSRLFQGILHGAIQFPPIDSIIVLRAKRVTMFLGQGRGSEEGNSDSSAAYYARNTATLHSPLSFFGGGGRI